MDLHDSREHRVVSINVKLLALEEILPVLWAGVGTDWAAAAVVLNTWKIFHKAPKLMVKSICQAALLDPLNRGKTWTKWESKHRTDVRLRVLFVYVFWWSSQQCLWPSPERFGFWRDRNDLEMVRAWWYCLFLQRCADFEQCATAVSTDVLLVWIVPLLCVSLLGAMDTAHPLQSLNGRDDPYTDTRPRAASLGTFCLLSHPSSLSICTALYFFKQVGNKSTFCFLFSAEGRAAVDTAAEVLMVTLSRKGQPKQDV